MGTSQSKLPELVAQEKLAERLRAILVKGEHDAVDADYIHIDREARKSFAVHLWSVSESIRKCSVRTSSLHSGSFLRV